MVSRESLIKYGTLALILFFVIEFFVPLMYVPQKDVEPTPAPSTSLKSFTGQGTVEAKISAILPTLLITCNSTLTRLDDVLLANKSVKNAYSAGNNLFVVEMNNASDKTAITSIANQTCSSFKAYSTARLQLLDKVTIVSGNNSLVLQPRQVDAFFQSRGKSGTEGVLKLDAKEGDTISIAVSASLQNDQLAEIYVEQLAFTITSVSTDENAQKS